MVYRQLALVFGLLLVMTLSSTEQESLMTESERYLKQMVTYVTPLMAILRKDQLRVKRQDFSDDYYSDPIDRDSYGGGGYQPCCDEKQDYVAILSIIALGLLFLFLIALLSTTTSSSGRKKRSTKEGEEEDNFIENLSRHDTSNNFLN